MVQSADLSRALRFDLERLRADAATRGDLILHLPQPNGNTVHTYSVLFGGAVLALEVGTAVRELRPIPRDEGGDSQEEEDLKKEVVVNEKDAAVVEAIVNNLYNGAGLEKLYQTYINNSTLVTSPPRPAAGSNTAPAFSLETLIQPDFTILLLDPKSNKEVERYRVHRLLLQERVPYYKTLFSSGFVDSAADESRLYTDDVEPQAMEAVLKFLYGSEIETEWMGLEQEAKKRVSKEEKLEEQREGKEGKGGKSTTPTPLPKKVNAEKQRLQLTAAKKPPSGKASIIVPTKAKKPATATQRKAVATTAPKPNPSNEGSGYSEKDPAAYLLTLATTANYLAIKPLHAWCFTTLRKLCHNSTCTCKTCATTLPHVLSLICESSDESALTLRDDILVRLTTPPSILSLWKRPLIVLPNEVHALVLDYFSYNHYSEGISTDEASWNRSLKLEGYLRELTELYIALCTLSTRISSSSPSSSTMWHEALIDPALEHCVVTITNDFDTAWRAVEWRQMLLSYNLFKNEYMENLLFEKVLPGMNEKNCRSVLTGLMRLRSAARVWLQWEEEGVERGVVTAVDRGDGLGAKERRERVEEILERAVTGATIWFQKRWVSLVVTTIEGKGFFSGWAEKYEDGKEIVEELAKRIGVEMEELVSSGDDDEKDGKRRRRIVAGSA